MSSAKKEITEDTAVVIYLDTIAERIKRDWDNIHRSVKELSGDKHIIRNERQAIDAFMRANIAVSMQAVNNIFTTEQAKRLNGWIMYFLDDENRAEVMKYNEIYEKAVKDVEEPVGTVAGALLFQWLGKDVKKLKGLGLRLQFLCMGIGEEFSINGRYWKTVQEKYKLTASDLSNRRKRDGNQGKKKCEKAQEAKGEKGPEERGKGKVRRVPKRGEAPLKNHFPFPSTKGKGIKGIGLP